jgi:hypothetical protein
MIFIYHRLLRDIRVLMEKNQMNNFVRYVIHGQG